jgi:hypothetical protein
MVKSTGNLPEPTTSDEAAIAHWLTQLAESSFQNQSQMM